MKSVRTKALGIPEFVKKEVHERDKGFCIFCGLPVEQFFACSHVIPRSAGGLGIPENIVTACFPCHNKMDSTGDREWMVGHAKGYLKQLYPDYDKTQLIYTKGWVR